MRVLAVIMLAVSLGCSTTSENKLNLHLSPDQQHLAPHIHGAYNRTREAVRVHAPDKLRNFSEANVYVERADENVRVQGGYGKMYNGSRIGGLTLFQNNVTVFSDPWGNPQPDMWSWEFIHINHRGKDEGEHYDTLEKLGLGWRRP